MTIEVLCRFWRIYIFTCQAAIPHLICPPPLFTFSLASTVDDGRNRRRFGAVFDGPKNIEDKSSLEILLFGSVLIHLKSLVLSLVKFHQVVWSKNAKNRILEKRVKDQRLRPVSLSRKSNALCDEKL